MLHQTFEMETATLPDLIEAKMIEGMAGCKSMSEIAKEIADSFAHFDVVESPTTSPDT